MKKAATYFQILSQHSPGKPEENHELKTAVFQSKIQTYKSEILLLSFTTSISFLET